MKLENYCFSTGIPNLADIQNLCVARHCEKRSDESIFIDNRIASPFASRGRNEVGGQGDCFTFVRDDGTYKANGFFIRLCVN